MSSRTVELYTRGEIGREQNPQGDITLFLEEAGEDTSASELLLGPTEALTH